MEQKIPTESLKNSFKPLGDIRGTFEDVNHKNHFKGDNISTSNCLATQGSSSDEFSLFGKFLTFFNAKIVS